MKYRKVGFSSQEVVSRIIEFLENESDDLIASTQLAMAVDVDIRYMTQKIRLLGVHKALVGRNSVGARLNYYEKAHLMAAAQEKRREHGFGTC